MSETIINRLLAHCKLMIERLEKFAEDIDDSATLEDYVEFIEPEVSQLKAMLKELRHERDAYYRSEAAQDSHPQPAAEAVVPSARPQEDHGSPTE